jgi:hypothetical protein
LTLPGIEWTLTLGGSLVVVPLLVLGGAAAADRQAGIAAIGVRRTFVRLGYMFIPVRLAVHLAHNLSDLRMEGGIVPVVQRAAALYTPRSLREPDWPLAPLAPEALVALLQVANIVGFFVLSPIAGHRLLAGAYANRRAAGRAFVPMAALS